MDKKLLNNEVNDVEDGVEPGQQGPPSATDEFGSGREAEDDAARNEVDSVEEKPVASRDENVTVESVLGDDDSDVRSIDLELVGSHTVIDEDVLLFYYYYIYIYISPLFLFFFFVVPWWCRGRRSTA